MQMNNQFKIQNLTVGKPARCLIIAEAGVNHNGSADLAHKLIETAAKCRADIVKFQTYFTDEIVTDQAPKAKYQLSTTSAGESQKDMLRALELPASTYSELKKHAESLGLGFLSTPFDLKSVELLEKIDVQAYKIPSGEITNFPLLEAVAAKLKPVLLSTGMSTLEEVREAVDCLSKNGNKELALFHCTSNYPTSFSDVNLNAMLTLKNEFAVPTGQSDHTTGIEVSVAAVALGAELIEKHLTLDNHMSGPDHAASMNPNEFSRLVEAVRNVEDAMGDGIKKPRPSEIEVSNVARKSLVAVDSLNSGTIVQTDHIALRRPGSGLSSKDISKIIGKRLNKNVAAGHLFSLIDFE